ncbi:hypothetical protein HMI54_010206 [Coelomomyces lativittatus]|nr:hypothetical protein HMI56_003998 [Coelomomyces lativittatus]KAJ1501164.1 hypothetical protein HMI54_010206 [Coelomomyces lativittatus]KAJ1508004.1 hypothetical protein HMI55_000555 [Coelomomyces lativittatus]
MITSQQQEGMMDEDLEEGEILPCLSIHKQLNEQEENLNLKETNNLLNKDGFGPSNEQLLTSPGVLESTNGLGTEQKGLLPTLQKEPLVQEQKKEEEEEEEREVETDSSFVDSDSESDSESNSEEIEDEFEDEEHLGPTFSEIKEPSSFEPTTWKNLDPTLPLTPLGYLRPCFETQVVIDSLVSGDRQVLDVGTPVVVKTHQVIGQIKDTFGPVHHPYFLVTLNGPLDPCHYHTLVFHVPDLSMYALTEQLKKLKGCDASNQVDQEVLSDELEFSDDEQEKAYLASIQKDKRSLHKKRKPMPSTTHRSTITPPSTTSFLSPAYEPSSSFTHFATTSTVMEDPLFSTNDFTEALPSSSLSSSTYWMSSSTSTHPPPSNPTLTPNPLLPSPHTSSAFPPPMYFHHPSPYPEKAPRPRIKVLAPGVIGIERDGEPSSTSHPT